MKWELSDTEAAGYFLLIIGLIVIFIYPPDSIHTLEELHTSLGAVILLATANVMVFLGKQIREK